MANVNVDDEVNIVKGAIGALNLYHEAQMNIQLTEAANEMAEALEELIRICSKHNAEVAEVADGYFAKKESEEE